MQYNRVGKSGLVVSSASLGSWLTYGDGVSSDKGIDIVKKAYEQGITSFDTANVYNLGAAELVLGKALKDIPRTKIVVASKVYWPVGDGMNEKGLNRKTVIEQTHASLKRLDMDYLDILYCHRYDPDTPLLETLRAIDDLIRQGKVLYYGVSEWTAKQIAESIHMSDKYLLDHMIVSQPSYHLLNRYIEKEVLPTCDEYGIGQMVFSPLAQGMLTGKYLRNQPVPKGSRADTKQGRLLRERYMTDEIYSQLEAFKSVSDDYGIPMHHLALAWINKNPSISSIILGASSNEQVLDNLKAFDIQLTEECIERIEAIFPV